MFNFKKGPVGFSRLSNGSLVQNRLRYPLLPSPQEKNVENRSKVIPVHSMKAHEGVGV
jgi:hypothetical protein